MKKIIYSIGAVVVVVLVALLVAHSISSKQNQTAGSTAVNSGSSATVAITSVSHHSGLAAVLLGSADTINWQTNNYPAGVGVNINLLQKVSSSPLTYTLVRQLGSNIPNTGSFTWNPMSDETGSNLYIEVTCANSTNLSAGCQIVSQPIAVN